MSSSFLAAAATLASDAAAETRVAAALRKLVDEGECRGTRLRHLPAPAAKRCAEHRDLDLNGNMLEALPAELFAPPSRRELRTLSACRNRLRHVDPSLSALRCKKLHLQCNALSAVPALPAGLQHLDLSSNLLAGHVEVGEPSSPQPELRVLRLGRNAIASLGLGLPALASLDVGRNALVELPAPLPPSLQKLSAPRNRLESLPPAALSGLPSLVELDLSFNQLSALPAELGALASLRALQLQFNRLRSLPACVWEMPALLELNLTANRLRSLPPPAAPPANLVDLWLARNGLRSLPTPLLSSPSITRLDLSSNRLSSLDVAGLKALRFLLASSNLLTAPPAGLGSCARLQTLFLAGNPIDPPDAEEHLLLPPLPALLEFDATHHTHAPASVALVDQACSTAACEYRRREASAAIGGLSVVAGIAEMCGRRRGMEDRPILQFGGGSPVALVGVLDGHGGHEAAHAVATALPAALNAALAGAAAASGRSCTATALDGSAVEAVLRAAFGEVAARLGEDEGTYGWTGTTATLLMIRDGAVTVANLGDSDAVLLSGRDAADGFAPAGSAADGSGCAEIVSEVHRPTVRAEEERICAAGGFVDEDGARCGMIAVSRALGDVALPPPHCNTPAVRHIPLTRGRHYTLVVASDGLWDVVEPDEVAGILRGAGSGASTAAAALRDEAFARGVTDNVTVALVRLYQA